MTTKEKINGFEIVKEKTFAWKAVNVKCFGNDCRQQRKVVVGNWTAIKDGERCYFGKTKKDLTERVLKNSLCY